MRAGQMCASAIPTEFGSAAEIPKDRCPGGGSVTCGCTRRNKLERRPLGAPSLVIPVPLVFSETEPGCPSKPWTSSPRGWEAPIGPPWTRKCGWKKRLQIKNRQRKIRSTFSTSHHGRSPATIPELFPKPFGFLFGFSRMETLKVFVAEDTLRSRHAVAKSKHVGLSCSFSTNGVFDEHVRKMDLEELALDKLSSWT